MLDRDAIAARLPHAGAMCLLDSVLHWDARGIRCRAVSQRDPNNPLRGVAGLAALAGIEYAAQAAAVHGRLLHSTATPRSGVLAALKNVSANRAWLHDVGEMLVEATLLHSDAAGGIYSFAAFDGTAPILSGQFTLMYIDSTQDTAV